jgi:hypothetical protein
VGAVVWSWRLIALNDAPSASIRINLARNTYPAGRERDWAMLGPMPIVVAPSCVLELASPQ